MNRAIDWFARNSVAANLMMIFILASGLLTVFTIKQEVFPEFSLDRISIDVTYLGAAPEEVEEGVCVRIEEAIQGVDGIKRMTSVASEGIGTVLIELELGSDPRKVVDDIKSRVDAIDTFPEETERPIIRELTMRRQVVDVAISGDVGEATLKYLAHQVRDEIAAIPEITQVEVSNARPYEISIEVSEDALRRHGLTFDEVAQAVRRSSLDLPGGSVRTASGEILLRTKGQAYRGNEYENLTLWTRPDGSRLRLGEVTHVVDGFAETDQFARFDGEPTVLVSVFRTGDQAALDVAAQVKAYVERAQARMPEGVSVTIWQDQSKVLNDRLSLLLRNGFTGFCLLFLVLALLVKLRLAFWISLGIPISFLGAIWLMPSLDLSINLMSLFAFILVLGIVVDDAIVVGENVFTHQEQHGQGLKGSIDGAQEIAVPVIFAVLTTVAAFLPLIFVPGMMGKFMRVIPLIVIPCLLFSLLESLMILPAHLSHMGRKAPGKRPGPWGRFQGMVARGLRSFIERAYRPSLEFALRRRYLTLALGLATLIITGGMVGGGLLRFQFFPSVEADFMTAAVTMRHGTPVEMTSDAVRQLEMGAAQVRREMQEQTGQDLFQHVYAAVGDQPMAAETQGPFRTVGAASASHLGEVTIELAPAENRDITSDELANRWREATGLIAEAVELKFNASIFRGGADIDIQLTGPDLDELRTVAAKLRGRLGEYTGVYEIADSFREGKQEIKLGIKPEAEVLGLTLGDLGRQIRQAFYGEEAQRIQRGRDDIRVMVRYPVEGRRSVGDLENMRVRTPNGGEVPFSEVAVVEPGRGYASIKRVDRNRAVNVTADVNSEVTSAGGVTADVATRILPEVLTEHPGVRYSFEGMMAEQRDTTKGLQRGFILALLMVFALLAVPLKSYVQPLIVMSAIPFGMVGAFWGHLIMGMMITMMSLFGMVALAGVVVNDSLVMVHFINRRRKVNVDLEVAIREAGVVRFRPILLTSLTTFAGLSPLLFERSMQAHVLIPMALSLAAGVLFATFVTLFLVPTGYLILEDVKALFRMFFGLGSEVRTVESGQGVVGSEQSAVGSAPAVVQLRSHNP